MAIEEEDEFDFAIERITLESPGAVRRMIAKADADLAAVCELMETPC